MQTRDQKLAAKIHDQVSGVAEADREKYDSMARKLPVLIRTAGLVQALAFVDTRGEDAHKQLLNHIAEVVGYANKDSLLKRSREAELSEYIHLSKQVMAALLWYKRFAESVLDVRAGEQPTERGS